MQTTLQKEMSEDEDLYDKLACWCNQNSYEKGEEISASEAKIAQLEATIESLTAKVAELEAKIKELEEQVVANKKALAEATALREKQIQESHGGELASIQGIENLKAAIVVLSKHHGGAFPQLPVSLLALGSRKDPSFEALMKLGGFDEATPEQTFLRPVSRSEPAVAAPAA